MMNMSEYLDYEKQSMISYDKYSECGEIGALYLLDTVKGKGFGRILFNKAINELKEMNYDKMILGYLSENISNEFYKHIGCSFVDTNPLTLSNGQELIENLVYIKKRVII